MIAEPIAEPVVSVEDLTVEFTGVRAVDGLSFALAPGAALGIVGESGSGKSATALALLGLHRGSSASVGGSVRVLGTSVNDASDEQVRQLRGSKIAMVFQDPLSALDPYFPVGKQIGEVYRAHTGASRAAARTRAIEVLDRVHIPHAARRVDAYPHELSGGMRQRALIAMALSCSPSVLVADEPTTALDVTVQAQVLDLIDELRRDTQMALILITHDLAVAAGNVDDVLVMAHGRAVERATPTSLLAAPSQSYTRELLAAVPRIEVSRASRRGKSTVDTSGGKPLLCLENVRKEFPLTRGVFGIGGVDVAAVDGVSLEVARGESLGIVGESGSGKTTLARMIVRLLRPTSGTVWFDGHDLGAASERAVNPLRRELQMVFQDPVSSLNPRRTIGESIAAPLRGAPDRRRIVRELLDRVGLDPDRIDHYPHEFSGGQRQRIGIARALAPQPKLLVCDEPVSALDMSTQANIMRLLSSLQTELGLTLIFVAHDLAVVRQISDRVAVMRQGKIVEYGPTDSVYDNPQHPYTKSLLAAIPILDPAQAHARRAERTARPPT